MQSFFTSASAGDENFTVAFAAHRDIDREWNLVKWNKTHREIDCHRLYYRTDDDGGRATLRLIDGTIEIKSRKVYFIPAFSVLQSEIDGVMNKYYIHFRSASPVLGLYRFLSKSYSVDATPLTEALFETVLQNYTKNTTEALMKVRGAMNLLLSDFCAEAGANSQQLLRFAPVLSYIEENYRRPIRLSELAAQMNVSPLYFSSYFKATFHISPKQYVLNKRLTESQRLLLESDMSVGEIARAVGFVNENYFSELFSCKMGISALKYRARAIERERKSFL